MKIVVCIKQVPSSNEVRLDPVTKTILRDGNQSVINPFDAYALEQAIEIKEQLGGEISVISMGYSGNGTLAAGCNEPRCRSGLALIRPCFCRCRYLGHFLCFESGRPTIGRF